MSRRVAPLSFALLGCLSCSSSLDSGDYGTFRFVGRVKGRAPLAVLAPISDRTGNIYTAYGAIGLPEVAVFTSRASGGSQNACSLTKGDTFGLHGWVGFNDDHAWYWSGYALVSVEADGNKCARVLDVAPETNADLEFKAVMPWVRVTSTRSTLVALVQSAGDPAPFSALVDLSREIMTNVVALPVTGSVAVLGVGADPQGDTRVTLFSRMTDTGPGMQAIFFDEDANVAGSTIVAGPVPPEYGIVGNLQMTKNGAFIGLTTIGSLVVFTRSTGRTIGIDPSITPVGVHRWQDAVYLVGAQGGRPVIVPIDDDGQPGAPEEWTASETAAAHLGGPLSVTDDRSFPAHTTTWTNVVSGIGTSPFLGPTSPWPHAPKTTLWVVAGPSDETAGLPVTSIAIVPVGLSYP